jgi:hypothetical protein
MIIRTYKSALPSRFRPRLEILENRSLLSHCTVSVLTDTGEKGDLRYCITQATDGDTISFKVNGIINLTGALPDLTHSIHIEGPRADMMTVRRDTGGDYRIFTVVQGATVAITGLTIAGGRAVDGSGIFNAGTLAVFYDILARNITGSSFGMGGGIYNAPGGDLTLSHSTVVENRAAQGGGVANDRGMMSLGHSTLVHNLAEDSGSAVYNSGELTLRNTTLSENRGAGNYVRGGGVYNSATLTLTNSTIAENAVDSGGGIYNAGTLDLRHTIVAHNRGKLGPDVRGFINSQGYNLVTDPSDAGGFVKTDLMNIDPRLGPLQDNGGPTLTYALMCDSPAIDAGDPTFMGPPHNDQRGEGYDRIVNGVVDIGAYEVQKGECDGSAPRGSRDNWNHFVTMGLTLANHLIPQSIFNMIQLSVALPMNSFRQPA